MFDQLLIVFLFLIGFSIWWYATIPSNLPPGPLGLPILGSAHKIWKASTLFKKLTEWSKQYGPLYKIYVGNNLVVVLGDWTTIQEALVKQGDVYVGRPVFRTIFPENFSGKGLANSEGELWKIQRRFALTTLRDFGFGRPIIEPRIKDESEYLLETIGAQGSKPFDIAPFLSNSVSNVICALVFGRRFDYEDKNFHRLLRLLRSRFTETDVSFVNPIVLSEWMAKLVAYVPLIKKLREESADIVEFVREQMTDAMKNFDPSRDEPTNYAQAFYKAKQDSDKADNWTFTDPQLLASVGNLFVAGTDTTATTLRWGIFYMAQFPEIQEKVYQEIKKEFGTQSLLNYADRVKLPFTEAVIMETQRMAMLLPVSLMRKTVAPSKLYGYDIPVGTVVAPVLGAALRDPKIYPNPEVFDPNRFLNEKKEDKGGVFSYLIPFSAGKRMCLGESLAKMELFIFFTAMVSRYKFYFPSDYPKPLLTDALYSLIHAPVPYKICAERRSE